MLLKDEVAFLIETAGSWSTFCTYENYIGANYSIFYKYLFEYSDKMHLFTSKVMDGKEKKSVKNIIESLTKNWREIWEFRAAFSRYSNDGKEKVWISGIPYGLLLKIYKKFLKLMETYIQGVDCYCYVKYLQTNWTEFNEGGKNNYIGIFTRREMTIDRKKQIEERCVAIFVPEYTPIKVPLFES